MSRETIAAKLNDLIKEEEEAARHLFVVCGQPSTPEGFYDAWANEDAAWFAQWTTLKAAARTMLAVGLFYE